MKLTITGMKIGNFKSIKEKEIQLNNVTKVYGDNETGKSTLADAIAYCLTGKNSAGETNFGILPFTADADKIVSPYVELECLIDGKPVTLKREYKAKFNRSKEFTGNYVTETSINDIPNTITTFDKYIEDNVADTEIFKLLTNSRYFTEQLKGKKNETVSQIQRRMLYDISNVKTDIEIAESEEKFKPLIESLQRFDDISDYKKSLKTSLTKINKEIDEFIPKSEQQAKNFIEIDFDKDKLIKDKEDHQAIIYEKVEEIDKMKTSLATKINQKDKEKAEFNKQISSLVVENNHFKQLNKLAYESKQSEKTFEIRNQISELKSKFERESNAFNVKKSGFDNQINMLDLKIDRCVKAKEELANKYKEEKSKTQKIDDTCPTCKQNLPEESIKAAIKTFQDAKTDKLDKIKAQGTPLAEEIAKLTEEKKTLETKIKDLKPIVEDKSIKKLELELKSILENADPFKEADMDNFENDTKSIESEIQKLEMSMSKEETDIRLLIQEKESELQAYKMNLIAFDDKIKSIEINKIVQQGIDILREENALNHAKKDQINATVELVDDFLEIKNKLATESVNNMFEIVKFKLFDFTKESQDFKEVCIPQINGVDYQDLSYSTKIIASLDIVKGFQRYYDKYLPLVIDNSESVNLETQLDCQVIFLTRIEENCPKCSGQAKRRQTTGDWTCTKCANTWKKTLEIK